MSFEKAMQRPLDYHKKGSGEQWFIDKDLGILDWDGKITPEQLEEYKKKYGLK